MTPDDITGIFEGTLRLQQINAQPAVLDAYIGWLSRNWRALSSDDLSALLCVGAAAYKLQKLTEKPICSPYIEAVPARLSAGPRCTDVDESAWQALI
ncbi:MAG: hypothetical protein ACRYGL_05565 [Janthinobacterium lividum]